MIIIQRTDTRKGRGGYRLDADPADCLIWEGNRNQSGYGRLWVESADGTRSLRYVHRAAWESWFGPIPRGWEIDHLCAQRACYRLDHLELVPRHENQRRVNDRVTHCPRGHEYTVENTYMFGSSKARICKICHRSRTRDARRNPVPPGLRREPRWVDVLELVYLGYTMGEITRLTGVGSRTLRKYFSQFPSPRKYTKSRKEKR